MGLHAFSGILTLIFLGALAKAGALFAGVFSILFDAGMVYGLWTWGLQSLKNGKLEETLKTAKIYVIGVGILLLVPLLKGNIITFILQGIAVGSVGYVWYKLQDQVRASH